MAQLINSLWVWLDQTALSQAIQAIGWIVPTVQTVHILSAAVVITLALMLDLRLIGLSGSINRLIAFGPASFPSSGGRC